MVVISFLILFFVLINFNLTIKKKLDNIDYKDLRLRFLSKNMNLHIVNLLLFILVYIYLFRFLRLYSRSDYIDLALIKERIYMYIQFYGFGMCIVLVLSYLVLLGFLKRISVFFLKNSFLSLNYFFFFKGKNYYNRYIEIIHLHRILWFWFFGKDRGIKYYKKYGIYIYVFFKFIGIILLIICLIIDLLINNNMLIWFSTILPWFSIYQLCYLIYNFLDQKIKLKMEEVVYKYIYCYEISTKKRKEEYLSTRDSSFSSNDVLIFNIIDTFGRPEYDEYDEKMEKLINEYLKSLLK